MSLRLLARLAEYAAQRQAVRLAESERVRRSAEDKLAALERRAAEEVCASDESTLAAEPIWHVRLGEQIEAAKEYLVSAENRKSAERQPLLAAYTRKLRYEMLLETRQREESDRRARAAQGELDEIGQRCGPRG